MNKKMLIAIFTVGILIAAIVLGAIFFIPHTNGEPDNESTTPSSVEIPTTTDVSNLTPTSPVVVEPDLAVNEALIDPWNIVDNDHVNETPIEPGLLLDDILDWAETTEFKEIQLHQRTYWDDVRLGEYQDVTVAEIVMTDDTNFLSDAVKWNVRMEKSDALTNLTNIEIPEDASISDTAVTDKNGNDIAGKYYFWENGDGTCTSMYITYFPDTQNLYTIYTNEVVFTQVNGEWESNVSRSPLVILNYIAADKTRKYDGPDANEIEFVKANGQTIVRSFRIKTFGEANTYQYEVGMTLGQWVNSKYNVDGWKFDSQNAHIVTSSDGRYKLNKDDYCWREMTAQLHGPIPTN